MEKVEHLFDVFGGSDGGVGGGGDGADGGYYTTLQESNILLKI